MDTFEQSLNDVLNKLKEKISAAEQRIASDNQILEEASREVKTFQELLTAYQAKKEADSEAAATFYTSGRTDADTIDFLDAITVTLPEELKQTATEEVPKETAA